MQNAIRPLAIIIISALSFSSVGAQDIDDFVKFSPNLWVAKYEVSNANYKEFISDFQKKNGKEKAVNFKADSTQWAAKIVGVNEPMHDKYHNHPAYNNYPVLNITKEAAQNYCKWLDEKYKAAKKHKFNKVVFRLPTEAEWMSFSSPLIGHRLPWYGNYPYLSDEKGNRSDMFTNIKMMDYASGEYRFIQDGAFYTNTIGSYQSNAIGIYDIIGNVAEITSDNKIKGGSWDNTLEECYIDLSQNHSLPDPRVGFRVVMEVIER